MTTKTERIRALNDLLRSQGLGGNIVVTRGIAALPPAMQVDIMRAVQTFTAFDADNDPHGEHDCAALEVAGHRVLFKIDYYDATLRGHTPDPAEPRLTRRVLTIMLAEEY